MVSKGHVTDNTLTRILIPEGKDLEHFQFPGDPSHTDGLKLEQHYSFK